MSAVLKFIEQVALHFPRRESSAADEVAWAKSMERNLSGFSPAVLQNAAEIIIGTCDRRDFQWLPKQCKEACFEARRVLDAQSPKLKFHGPKADANHNDREKLAYELILGAMGKTAAREGWVHSLFTFTRDHMRLPENQFEINECIDAARGFDHALDCCRNAPDGSFQSTLVSLGVTMLTKRQKLENYVQTGVLP